MNTDVNNVKLYKNIYFRMNRGEVAMTWDCVLFKKNSLPLAVNEFKELLFMYNADFFSGYHI